MRPVAGRRFDCDWRRVESRAARISDIQYPDNTYTVQNFRDPSNATYPQSEMPFWPLCPPLRYPRI